MKRSIRKCLAVLLSLGFTAGLGGCGQSPSTRESEIRTEPATAGMTGTEEETAGDTAGISGEFTGEAVGYNGKVIVKLTLSDGILTQVTAEGPGETPDIGGNALTLMPPLMVASNSVEVDGISGATLTSNAILEAAAQALSSSGASLEIQTVEIEQNMTPGTYYGEAYGKWKEGTSEGARFGSPKEISPIRVAVTVDRETIKSVVVESCDDTPGFIEEPMERIPADIVAYQSIAVDSVSGATMTSQAILSAAGDALAQAGAELAGFTRAVPRSTDVEEYTTDVAVVGGGGAGTCAALTLQQAGIDVIVVEKTAKVGGESVCSTGMLAAGSAYLESLVEDKSLLTSTEDIFSELMDYSHWTADSTVVSAFLDRNGETCDWLQTMWDQTSDPGYTGVGQKGKNGLDTGKGTMKYQVLYDEFFIPAGGRLLLDTRAYELLTDGNGAVNGVKARKSDGTEVIVHASQVILATGGFAGSPELLDKYFHNSYYLYGMSTDEGDGLLMAQAAGAGTPQNLDPFLAEFCSNEVCDFYAGYMKYINYTGFLQLNRAGTRFYNEEFGASDPLAKGAAALNTAGEAYVIFTQADLDLLEEGGGGALISEEVREQCNNYRSRACVPFTTIKTEMQAAIDAGQGWKADTLEELGKAVGIWDMDIYNDTIRTYLDCVEAKEDKEFGKRPEMLYSLEGSRGPFYCVRVVPAIDSTLGGIPVNGNCQVLTDDKTVIPGLYAAGQDASGFWGNSYYQTEHTNALTQAWAVTSGRIAGAHIAASRGREVEHVTWQPAK